MVTCPDVHSDTNRLEIVTAAIQATQSAATPPPIVTDVDEDFNPDSEEDERNSKARFTRRLREQWLCKIPGHTYCFLNTDGAHVCLSEDDMNDWASTYYHGMATLFIPPPHMLQLKQPLLFPPSSTVAHSPLPGSTPYQRPFRLQSSPSLTDIRSMRMRLNGSLENSSVSSGFSGPPIGHGLGTVAKWVGARILDAYGAIVLWNRRRTIRDLIKKAQQLLPTDRAEWSLQKERKLIIAAEDLLELSRPVQQLHVLPQSSLTLQVHISEYYKPKARTTAINEGRVMHHLIGNTYCARGSDEAAFLGLLFVKTLPLDLMQDASVTSSDFIFQLRETLLHDPSQRSNSGSVNEQREEEDLMMAEVVALICHELIGALTTPLSWQEKAYFTLYTLYETPGGKRGLQTLGANGRLMHDLATSTFASSAESMNMMEHAHCVYFFSEYANDMASFRTYLSRPVGIPLLVRNFRSVPLHSAGTSIDIATLRRFCQILSRLHGFEWCIPIFIQLNLCISLAELLIFLGKDQYHDHHNDPFTNFERSNIAYDIIFILRQQTIAGGEVGKHTVEQATTDEILKLIPGVQRKLRRELGDERAERTRCRIEEIWPRLTADVAA